MNFQTTCDQINYFADTIFKRNHNLKRDSQFERLSERWLIIHRGCSAGAHTHWTKKESVRCLLPFRRPIVLNCCYFHHWTDVNTKGKSGPLVMRPARSLSPFYCLDPFPILRLFNLFLVHFLLLRPTRSLLLSLVCALHLETAVYIYASTKDQSGWAKIENLSQWKM